MKENNKKKMSINWYKVNEADIFSWPGGEVISLTRANSFKVLSSAPLMWEIALNVIVLKKKIKR